MIHRYLVWLHRWTGLLMPVFLIVVGLTGALLAFWAKLDRLLNPQLDTDGEPGQSPLDLATLAVANPTRAGVQARAELNLFAFEARRRSMSRKFSLRDVIGIAHRWTGLVIAVFLIILGLTGTLLAFRGHIDALFNPGLHVKHALGQRQLPLAVLAERAEAELPHARLGFFAVEGDQVIFHLVPRTNPATSKPYSDAELHLALNPYTGARLHCGPTSDPGRPCHDVMGFIYDLHTSLTTRTDFGWKFVGVIALIWTIDCFVAIVLTLPRSKGQLWPRWRQAWGVKWRASFTRVNFDLHRAGGLWLWPLLFVFAWSSVMLGLHDVYDPVMKHIFPYVTNEEGFAARMAPHPVEHPKLNWPEAEGIGAKLMAEQAALHHFTVERPYGMAYVPVYGSYVYGVRSSLDFRGHSFDTTVSIDGNTGQLRSLDLPRGQHLGNTISTLLWGIHYGDLRDWPPFRLFIGCFGVFLTMLSVTGVVIWWKKRRVRNLSERPRNSKADHLETRVSDERRRVVSSVAVP